MTNPKTHCFTVFRDQYKGVDIFEEEEDIQNKHQEAKFEENTNINLNHLREVMQKVQDKYSHESQQKQTKTGKKSLNHNFQKHAVTTIKKLMRMRYNRDGTLVQKLAHEMWNIFMASGIKSKKILVILFGLANMNDQSFIHLLKKCGFEEILCYDQNLIRSAQQILRNRLVQSVNQNVARENIANCRNIKMSQQFLVYFLQLLQTLREGPLLKLRINDRTAKKIQATIKAQKAH